MSLSPHKNLVLWKESMELIKCIYQIIVAFPESEKFGVIAQYRRASISIILNIAEGAARISKMDFNHFLNISQGSISEIDALTEVSLELNFIYKNIYD